jgi:predicted Zn-dependent protease
MFKIKTQNSPTPPDESVRRLEKSLLILRVTADFFPGIQIRPGERIEDAAARSIGITREAFDQTFRWLRSIEAGRVIKPGE